MHSYIRYIIKHLLYKCYANREQKHCKKMQLLPDVQTEKKNIAKKHCFSSPDGKNV